MRLLRLQVENFGCVRSAAVECAPGLNVLFGPNDLGKSSLIQAVRAALLLPHTSSAHEAFVPWQGDLVPRVDLAVELDRVLRVQKTFGAGSRGSSLLLSSRSPANCSRTNASYGLSLFSASITQFRYLNICGIG